LKSIAKKISNKTDFDDEKEFIKTHLIGVTVIWSDGAESIERDIDFSPQSYMYEIAEDKGKTNSLIKKVISNKEENKFLIEYNAKNNELKKTISKNILDIFQLQLDIENLQLQLKEKGDRKGVETEIQRLNIKIQEFSKNATITTQDIEIYQNSLKEILEKEQLIKQADNDLLCLSTITKKTIIDTYYINEFGRLSLLIKNDIVEYFNKFKDDIDMQWTKYIESIKDSIQTQKQGYQAQIETTQNSDIFKKRIYYLANNCSPQFL
jgi:hypothetical protein